MSAWGVSGVSVTYGDRPALDEVSVDVRAGEVTAVVGGDGAGKTTLCKVTVGLVRPATGVVRVPGRIGYQSETSGVWGDLTVVENLEFVAVANRLGGAERRARIEELMQVTRLDEAADRLAADLSGGMRQKLGVAAAVLAGPELLVLDEPTTGLDPVSRADLWRLISRFVGEGMAVLSTTTYLNEAETANRALALESGRTLAAGTVEDIIASMQGAVGVVGAQQDALHTWRRGDEWRAWFPDGVLPDGIRPIHPDLTDVVTVSAMAEELSSWTA